jgi:arylsulfatase A-like enzyme
VTASLNSPGGDVPEMPSGTDDTPTAPSDAPNVLFFFPDQHRHDWIGAAGTVPVRTPTLDRLARRGVRFTNAVCPAPVCAPSRGCLATGLEYDRNPVTGNADDLPTDARTYFRRLRDEAGYHVMGCGKFDLHKGSFSWGVDGTDRLDAWGFSDGVDNAGKIDGVLSLAWDEHPTRLDLDPATVRERAYEAGISGTGRPAEPYTAFLDERGLLSEYVRGYRDGGRAWTWSFPEAAYIDNWIARRGLELLEDAPGDRPWHLVVNFAGPHPPFDVTERMHGRHRDPDLAFPAPVEADDGEDAPDHAEIRRNYAAMIENIDRWLGEYLDALEARGEREDTLVVFASDHGEMLGDHGRWGKGRPRQPSVGVPMVAAGPGVAPRSPVDSPVSALDLHETFLDYAGLGTDNSTDSRTLRSVLEGRTDDHRDCVLAGLDDWRLVFDGRYKLVTGWTPGRDDHVPAGTPGALFDLETDPDEAENLIDDRPGVVGRLEERLDRPV